MQNLLLLALFVLNSLDLIFTRAGLAAGVITEANPLMNSLISASPATAYTLKLLLPLPYIFLALKFMKNIRWIPKVTACLVCIYTIVIGLHLGWIIPHL